MGHARPKRVGWAMLSNLGTCTGLLWPVLGRPGDMRAVLISVGTVTETAVLWQNRTEAKPRF